MRRSRRKQLEAAGFRVGDAADFLELDEGERLYLEIRRGLGRLLRQLRRQAGLSQVNLAATTGLDQATISRSEQANPGVSLDLIVSALIASGASRDDIAGAIRSSSTESV